jgi:hypothetical protein
MNDWVVSVDLGKTQDYTAISCTEVVRSATGKTKRRANGQIVEEYKAEYHVRHIERPPLRTTYHDICGRVVALLSRPELAKAHLIVDATGIGAPVVEIFREAGLSPIEVVITPGHDVKYTDVGYNVPKKDLAGVLQKLIPSGKLKVATGLEMGPVLEKELKAFKAKQSAKNVSYESAREGDHDDVVLSVAIACWYAENSQGRFGLWFQAPDPPQGSVAWEQEQVRKIRLSLTRQGHQRGPWYKRKSCARLWK